MNKYIIQQTNSIREALVSLNLVTSDTQSLLVVDEEQKLVGTIDYNIDRLISYGVKRISVTVNYLKEQIEEHFKEPRGEVQVKTVREPKILRNHR